MADLDWTPGDISGLSIPAHSEALREGGTAFLTRAFHASGALAPDNRVSRITHFEAKLVGGTGSKLILSVAYEKPEAGLPTDLFVKFSRNLDDPFRDRLRYMLDSEVRFAVLTRLPGFPIAVPNCLFADYHAESATGIIITDRIAYGADGIEPHHQKCMDYELAEPLEHYKAIVKALARVAGAHKAGRLAKNFDEQFPFDAGNAIETDRVKYNEAQFQRRVENFATFAASFPHLVPKSIAAPRFASQLAADIPLFLKHERAIKTFLYSNPNFMALCHWNANIDNAWFWRTQDGELECGLIDWARVGQMSVAQALFGCFSSADPEIWRRHLDEILAVFAAEYHRTGGPVIDVQELKLQVHFVTMMMGLSALMDAPKIVQNEMPDLATVDSPLDPRFVANETARVQLHMLTVFLTQWQTHDFGKVLDQFERRVSALT